jgi:hypothetical protein
MCFVTTKTQGLETHSEVKNMECLKMSSLNLLISIANADTVSGWWHRIDIGYNTAFNRPKAKNANYIVQLLFSISLFLYCKDSVDNSS